MASSSSTTDLPFKMHVTPDNTGLWHIKQTGEAAEKVTELLEKDMEPSTAPPPPPPLSTSPTQPTPTINAPSCLSTRDHLTFHPWPAAAQPYFGKEEVGVMELLEEIKGNEKLARAARNEDGNKVRDGVLARAKEEMIALAARVRVRPEEVEERTAEMFNAAVFVAAAAALVKEGERENKFDFFLMHHVNSSPIFVTINALDWIPAETKARLLEWKIRMDLLQFVARGVPELSLEKLKVYKPRKPDAGGSLAEIVSRLHTLPDDGHAIKLGRAAVICHNICKRYEEEGKPWLRVQGEDMWKKICHLIVDSVEAPGAHWVRSAGFDEAWKDVPKV
ncbi:hypothetical protein N0V88_002301 [Collariella sp. IMI 366227]|nr:hypothetical protein N0V88_002301 [Collariella sp. IMI 366227]